MHPTPSFEKLVTQLAPTLAQLETERQTVKKKVSKRIFGCFLIVGAITAAFYIILDGLYVIFFGLLAFFAMFNHISRSKLLCTKYKNTIISRMVEIMVENGQYSPSSGIPEETFNESGLFRKLDRYSSEDLITGKIGNTEFRFAEVYAEEISKGAKDPTYWNTIFQGFMFVADFHKHFAGHTTVSRNSLFKFKRGRVRLENPEFEKRFDVFSDDQVEARYLLTPFIMERIVELDKRFENGIVLSFRRSNIMIFVNNSMNHFEASLWSEIDNKETLFEEYSIISALIAIVDELNLNTRIWTKK